MIEGYDNWKLQSGHEDEEVVTYCCYCSEDIYKGEVVEKVDDGFLHEDCLEAYARKTLVSVTIHGVTKEDI